jgi:two-component system CheB/CheR fusion protein
VHDLEGRIIAWNQSAVRTFGWSEAEALTMNIRDRIPEGLREDALDKLQRFSLYGSLEPHLTKRIAKNGAVLDVTIISTALMDEAGKIYAIATTERVAAL